MPVELRVPKVGESITEVQVGEWLRAEGEAVDRDEPVVVIETDKATMEIPAPVAGKVVKRLKQKGEMAKVGEVIGLLEEGAPGTAPATPAKAPEVKPRITAPVAAPAEPAPARPAASVERRLPPSKRNREESAPAPSPAATPAPAGSEIPRAPKAREERVETGSRAEEVVPMSMFRRRLAERLVQAQQAAALLTTFNEVDMGAVMELRKRHQEAFVTKYGVKLGIMSFFVKATIDALRQFPQLNAEVRGTDVVYRNYYDIGVAVGSGKGLVVPVLRNAERLSFAEVELAIADFAKRWQDNRINPAELQGGTFTISNGGVYGSLMSTPIVNPPQSGILGLHAIQDRPVAREGQVVIRPMMYVAVTYDHRIVDGRESVTFLKRIKEAVEEPARMLVEI
jgi:2-oxoglutarate dehydrogenase E2 component (dihydrolipoamide succinyltransferase)